MRVYTDPHYIPDSSPPAIIIHVLRENKRPIGYAPWLKEPKKRKKKKGGK